MADMKFFAKKDCITTQQQKRTLQGNGNVLCCFDIMAQEWTKETLLPFVRGRDPLQIIDCSAKEILNGKIDPVLITFEEAVTLMVVSPHLIKGPLIEVDGLFIQGFEDKRLSRYLGSREREEQHIGQQKIKEKRSVKKKKLLHRQLLQPFYSQSFA